MSVETASSYPRLQLASRLACSLAILTGGLVLAGWLLDIAALKSVFPGLVTMKANTALAFMLAGGSLWLLQREPTTRLRLRIARAAALLVILIGFLTLSEYFSGRDFGIDQLLFTESTEGLIGTSHPGRMAPASAISFLLIGLALFLLDMPRGQLFARWLTLATGLFSLISLVGYLYGVAALYAVGPYSSMALHTSLNFLILSAGLLFSRPDRGFMAVLTSDTAGGIVARRLLPAAVGIPIVVGALTLVGQRAGLYEAAFGVALFATSNLVVFIVLIGLTTGWLSRVDAARKHAQEEIKRYSRGLEARVQERTAELAVTNKALEIEITQHRIAEEERERLIADLQEAVGKIQVLQGILPICSHCKMIRDGQGEWHPVESYVRARSQAEFSHGICPTCLSKHYPGLPPQSGHKQ